MIVLMQVQTDYELIEEKYDQLLNYFNEKSPETNIYLCSLCPRVDTLVSDINEIIKEYVMIIRVLKLMCIMRFNKRGQLKIHFYQPRDTIHLSTSGTKEITQCYQRPYRYSPR